ncbi:MAG: ATP-binding cassette domain-containing protein [Clostridia bacterium]|nr:ATP-binding cassette domain-containing protein [Clostridia bacterium]
MLELRNITKDYPTGNETVHALKGVSLSFRRSEFVSILGQSGCGKTTLLNIIGGLDRYTEGDLIINGRSTKKYNDRDWDTYRNHSVGFVFQSYNLIPHQTVLQNVELALTLSGVSKSERRKRAKEALAAVGLTSQLNKKPSEMSGGQMQRVAIARAIVNNPDIILADEPTGALDSETSIQVMEILKEISKERLVVMVTHNPELAEMYSTRTVRMLDGIIISDSMPLTEEEIEQDNAELEQAKIAAASKKQKKPSMSFFTSFGLSIRNLFTKKGRTVLTSFAGSIGIIGIALIYAVSEGTTSYISYVQESTLSSYPITLEAQHVSVGTLMDTFIGAAKEKEKHPNDAVYQNPVLYDLVNTLSQIEAKENDLRSFKEYLNTKLNDNENDRFNAAINGIQYSYGVDLNIYTKNVDGTIIKSNTEELIQKMLLQYMGEITGSQMSGDTSMLTMLSGGNMSSMMRVWQELLPGKDGSAINPLIKKQYELVHGEWPNEYDEIVIVVDENNEIDDMTLYALGLISDEEIDKIVKAAANNQPVDFEMKKWSYEDICKMEFKTILNADLYSNIDGVYQDISAESMNLSILYNQKAVPLKVTGIIKLKEGTTSTLITGNIGYTYHLTEYIAEENRKSDAIIHQINNPTLDIFTGLPFADSDGLLDNAMKAEAFKAHISNMSAEEKAETYLSIISIPPPGYIEDKIEPKLAGMTPDIMREALISQILASQASSDEQKVREYVGLMSNEDLTAMISGFLAEQETAIFAQTERAKYADKTPEELAAMLDDAVLEYDVDECAGYYDTVFEFSASTYEMNLQKLGYIDLEQPTTINLFATSFADKDVIEEMIVSYNNGVDEISRIEYTDYMGIMMSSITTIINAIKYVLIAFVSVSLIVSSIMIGVITLISVQERTKEIGILRAIGASKRNVCSMFNAETVIIGFASGLIGVLFTYLICIPINAILFALTGITNLRATLDIRVAIALVVISVLLTLISGLIPSRGAAKKDPVVALRTE